MGGSRLRVGVEVTVSHAHSRYSAQRFDEVAYPMSTRAGRLPCRGGVSRLGLLFSFEVDGGGKDRRG